MDLLEQARKNESGTPPRKHHLVPASYLRRWAEGGVIRVTDLDDNNSYLCAPEKAARETDFYRIDHPDIPRDEVPPLVFETLLGHLEVDFRTFVM